MPTSVPRTSYRFSPLLALIASGVQQHASRPEYGSGDQRPGLTLPPEASQIPPPRCSISCGSPVIRDPWSGARARYGAAEFRLSINNALGDR